jgi:predicted secreted protein
MSPSLIVFAYLNAWWISLFLVAPFAVELTQKPQGQDYAAAPKRIRWRFALVATTLVSAVLTALFVILLKSGIVPLRHVL